MCSSYDASRSPKVCSSHDASRSPKVCSSHDASRSPKVCSSHDASGSHSVCSSHANAAPVNSHHGSWGSHNLYSTSLHAMHSFTHSAPTSKRVCSPARKSADINRGGSWGRGGEGSLYPSLVTLMLFFWAAPLILVRSHPPRLAYLENLYTMSWW